MYRELEITSGEGESYLSVGAWTSSCIEGLNCVDTLDSIVVYEEQEQSRVLTDVKLTTFPSKVDYLKGESLDTTGLVLTAEYDDGYQEEIRDYTISGYDAVHAGQQNVIVSYMNLSDTFSVTVHEISAMVVVPPTKLNYLAGELFDDTGLVVKVNCLDGYEKQISDYMISGFDTNKVGIQDITVSYQNFTSSFQVTVESNLAGLEITNPPEKLVYKQGETFETTGMVISAVSKTGEKTVVTDYEIVGFDSSVLGTYNIQILYQGQMVELSVQIIQNILTATCGTPTLSNVTATLDVYSGELVFQGTGAIKTYSSSATLFSENRNDIKKVRVGEGITNIGGYLFYKCSNLSTVSLPTTVKLVSSYAFYECKALKEIENSEKITSVSSYSFRGCTSLKSISLGEKITAIGTNAFYDCANMVLISINVEYQSITGYPWGAANAKIEWGTYPLARLELVLPPQKTEYKYGEDFIAQGISVRVFYLDNEYRDITEVAKLIFAGFKSDVIGKQIVTVTYRTVSTSFEIKLANYETGIKLVSLPEKLSYEDGEAQDLSGLIVAIVYANGDETEITEYETSEINYEILGSQNITVSYHDFIATFQITGDFAAPLKSLLGVTENMVSIRENKKNDTATDAIDGASWFNFNHVVASTIYVNGNNCIGFGASLIQLKVCYRDGATYYVRRLEGKLNNGHRFLKLEVEGYTRYNYTTSDYKLIYELFLFDDNSMFLNVITVPTAASYIGVSGLNCGDEAITFAIETATPVMYSFYPSDMTGVKWSIHRLPHQYLLTGIELTVLPTKSEYHRGTSLDLSGMEVVLFSELGKVESVTEYTIRGFDPMQVGEQTVFVSYLSFETSFQVKVVDGFVVRFLFYDFENRRYVIIKEEKVNYGTNVIPPENTERPGYIFTGWSGAYENITEDIDIYAEYIPKNVCTVTFVDAEETILKKQYVLRGCAATAPEVPLREGFIFSKWDKSFSNITEDLTITAVYLERTDSYVVKFIDWNGKILKSEEVIFSGSATPPVVPEREGYFFFSWSNSYEYVTENITTHAIYRQNRGQTSVEFYNGNVKAGEIKMAIDCTVSQRLNGECTIELTTLTSYAAFIGKHYKIEIDQLVFDVVGIDKKTQNGTYLTTINGEHVSYILNEKEYDIEKFSFSGNPKKCLKKILKGTPFIAGKVDFTSDVTLKVNQETTRRNVLMQLVALCGGEIEYCGYQIGIRSHLGKEIPINLLDTENVKNLGMTYNANDNTETYSVEVYKRQGVSLGDEVHIEFRPLSINKTKRITEIEWNPFNFRKFRVGVGGYRASLNDSLYVETEKNDTTKDKVDKIENDLNNLSNSFDSLSDNIAGFNVLSVESLPNNPDRNTIYLIQGAVEVS